MGNLAVTFQELDRVEEASRMSRDVYSGRLKLYGEEHPDTIREALNYASALNELKRFKEVKGLLRRATPVARRVLGNTHDYTLTMRKFYAKALYLDSATTLDDLREAVTTLEDLERILRRVFGGAHPLTVDIEKCLQKSRAVLAARETASPGSP